MQSTSQQNGAQRQKTERSNNFLYCTFAAKRFVMINIAIDGYSSCGKSTLAKAMARALEYVFIDSGAMYRAVTLYALRNKLVSADGLNEPDLLAALPHIDIAFRHNPETGRSETLLNGENVEQEIRKMAVSNHVSKVSAVKAVRQKLVALQQQLGRQKGVVMDGRDIGTVVFPTAELKLFMTADPAVRAQRRFDELVAKGQQPTMEEVAANLSKRDKIDTTRAESPLMQADDAVVIDNTHLTPEQQLEKALSLVQQRLSEPA